MKQLIPRRALISVSDKAGIVDFAKQLCALGVELVSTGGTHKLLLEAGLPAIEVAQVTGFPEGLDGRVKTLHPAIHAGLLALRGVPNHDAFLARHQLAPIDLLICNLYPFESTVARPGVTHEEIIENIDIGGPAMVRSACKNYHHVGVVTDSRQYPQVMAELNAGGLTEATLERLAREAFLSIARYDASIAQYFCERGGESFPTDLPTTMELRASLRYGENPHQRAALYLTHGQGSAGSLARAEILHGKELSYNNWLDLDAAWSVVRGLAQPAACVIKHTNPCGAAVGNTALDAFTSAYDADPISAFGGIVGLNRPVDASTAESMAKPGRFLECIVAPDFSAEAIEILTTKPTWKKSIRLVRPGSMMTPLGGMEFRSIDGGVLVQDVDRIAENSSTWKTGSKREATDVERQNLELAWHLVARVKSNAIVLVKNGQLVGVGQGQTSRVESVRLAVAKAGDAANGAVLGSDAFFPFRDGVDTALKAGITAIVQPGGSVRDADTVAACDEQGAALIFTGVRHFRH